jgi:hypothetical protein
MRAWLIQPDDSEPQELTIVDVRNTLNEVRPHFGKGSCLDITRVISGSKVCTMAIDDHGHSKRLPINMRATAAYRLNCKPGTTHVIFGPAVIFDGLLP